MKKLKLTPLKLTKDFFISNNMLLTDNNIEEYGLTYKLNRYNNKGSFYIIYSTILVPTYSDEKCRIANPFEIEITDYMPPVYIKSYT